MRYKYKLRKRVINRNNHWVGQIRNSLIMRVVLDLLAKCYLFVYRWLLSDTKLTKNRSEDVLIHIHFSNDGTQVF